MISSVLGDKSNIRFTTPGVLTVNNNINFIEPLVDEDNYDNSYVVEFYTPNNIREGVYSVDLNINTQKYIDKNNILELCNDSTAFSPTEVVGSLDFEDKDKEFFGLIDKGASLVEVDIEHKNNVVVIIGALVLRKSAPIKLNENYYYPFRVIGNKGKVKIKGAKKMIYDIKGIV